MEGSDLEKGRKHCQEGKVFMAARDFEKALKQFEFSLQYYIEVLAGESRNASILYVDLLVFNYFWYFRRR